MIRIAASDYRITGLHPKICAPVVLEGREFYLIEHKDTKAQSLLFLSLCVFVLNNNENYGNFFQFMRYTPSSSSCS